MYRYLKINVERIKHVFHHVFLLLLFLLIKKQLYIQDHRYMHTSSETSGWI